MELLQEAKVVRRGSGNGFFIWSVVLLLMTGVCFASWIGSFYVVAHPENPRCYRILKKFKRVDPPKRFSVTDAPKGEFLTAAKLLERFGKFGKLELANENALLLRNYVTNFRESGRRVPYVAGKFQIVQSFALQNADFLPSGAVAIAQVESLPQVLVEFLFPAEPEEVRAIRETVTMGADVTLQRSQDLWALLHVERYADGRMEFTVMPLPYGGWQLKRGQGSFSLRSPEELLRENGFDLNLAAGLPVVRDPRLRAALNEHKEFRRKLLVRGDDQAALAGPELVRIEPEPPEPAGNSTAKNSSATPAMPASAAGKSTPNPSARRAQVARPVPTPAPSVPLPPRALVQSKPASGIIGAQVEVLPPRPVLTTAENLTAAPKPRAARRVLSTAQASGMVDRFSTKDAAVLSGDFVVTGVLGRRVALRTSESLRDLAADPKRAGSSAALIVVEFPEGAAIPEKDAAFAREGEQGFVIRAVIRDRTGQVTIVANERAADEE